MTTPNNPAGQDGLTDDVERAFIDAHDGDSIYFNAHAYEIRWAVNYVARHLSSKKAASGEVPEGWKLVPIEPTHDMCSTIYGTSWITWNGHVKNIWRNMLAAAPSAGKEKE